MYSYLLQLSTSLGVLLSFDEVMDIIQARRLSLYMDGSQILTTLI